MKNSLKTLEKDWGKILKIVKIKLLSGSKKEIPKDLFSAVEYITLSKTLSKKFIPKIVVINGPGGVGKSTIGKILEKNTFKRIPRITDRKKRLGEVHGKDYHFVKTQVFDELLKKGKILAGKNTYQSRRGFLKDNFKNLSSGKKTKIQYYTEGDSSLQALKEARKEYPIYYNEVLNIFILPPSFKELNRRISQQFKSGHFTKKELEERLKEGIHYLRKSITHFKTFPNSIFLVNDNIARIRKILSFFKNVNVNKENENLIPYFNENKEIAGITTKNLAHTNALLHPISVIYLFNSKHGLLIQKRLDVGLWDHSAAGHVDLGENFLEAAKRELREELGIVKIKLSLLTNGIIKHRLTPKKRRHYFHLFTCNYNGPIKINSKEVLKIKYITIKKLEKELKNNPKNYTGGLHATYKYFKNHYSKNT